MYVESLELKDFRNYEELNITFGPHINILFGDNAQGKTNILEALYLSVTTKSHRGSKDKDMIRFEKTDAHIKTFLNKDDVTHKVDMHLHKKGGKGAAIDGLTVRRSSELFGLCNMIFFSPEDLSMIKNGPSERRRFLDTSICQLDKVYLTYLAKYNKVLYQRNQLLKQIYYDKSKLDMLPVWDEQLVTYGSYIIKRRASFLEELNEIIVKKHKQMTGGKEVLHVEYEPNTGMDVFRKNLEEKKDIDLKNCNTCVGPHRDDIKFLSNDIDVRLFGSQGQQRTTALSLKLSEIEMVKNNRKDAPILLLDDVLSELDMNRQNYLLKSLSDVQVIITCTGLNEFVNNRLKMDVVYEVTNGTVSKKER